MPTSYSIDPVRRLVTSRIWGVVTNEEVLEHNRLLSSDPAFNPSYRQFADMSGVTRNLVTFPNVQETARDQYFTPGTRRALVVADDNTFGLCRMFATYAEAVGQTIEVFREREAAEAWLGLKE
jgi:hypothetical protein